MDGPDSALRRLTREAGKLLRPYGFHGTEASWTQVTGGGVASIRRTRVQRTWTDGQQALGFGLELSATPTAWWEYRAWCDAERDLSPTALDRATGPGLIDSHGLSADLTELWSLRVDPAHRERPALQSDVDAVRADLPVRVHAYARRALRLLEPDAYLDELLAQANPSPAVLEAIVVLLAEHGPGPRLDHALTLLSVADPDEPGADNVIAYLRGRAVAV
ncbi:hypothetical protein [Nocardia alba]|uniref:Uncharacterized protein n=1 Tax=Nocardia alba TaxID=225051 RepID=A0A4R1FA86_9NOCA|nr:hypothetical protein [Nocardia alba]TCJ89722.1 hypothetical protein DFR71_6359 [Nocardia alba]